ncbi:hypothetical protein [Planctomycetes bacterium Poly30]|uniref:hypothetical protein n=1 Tax=Saltatorellus ferox TaxID=2528018 RepID=UPI0011AAC3AC
MNRFSAPHLSRSLSPVLVLCALASCNDGGGKAGGVIPVVQTVELGGAWNFFQEGLDCDGSSFRALPMEIEDVASGEFVVRIGEPGSAFEFAGLQMDSSLVFGGSSTVGGVTLEIPSATWAIAANLNKLSGPLEAVRTEGGVDCAFTGAVEAFKADATQTSLVRGDWRWTLETDTVNGSCTAVGETQILGATLWPKRQNQFLVELALEDGDQLQFEGSLSGARLDVFGSDTLASGDEVHMVAGSFLTIAPGGVQGAGEFDIEILGSGPCEYTAIVTAERPSIGEPMIPFLRDVEGAQALMGIPPESPEAPVTLVDSLGSEVLGAGATNLSVQRIAEIVERRVLDGMTGETVTTARDGLVYTAGGDIFWVDLAQRFDANGERAVLPPVRVFAGNGTSIRELSVYVDLAQTTTVIVGERASDSVMIELQAIEEASASVLVSSTTEVLGMLMDATGSYHGMATLGGVADELRRLSVDQSSGTLALGVESVAISPKGALYFTRPGELLALDAGAAAPALLDSAAGGLYALGRFDGERMFIGRDDINGATLLSREPGSAPVVLAQTNSVGAGGAAFSDLVPVGDRVIFTMIGGSGTRRLIGVPKAGGTFELLVAAPDAANFSPALAQVLGDQAYFTALPISTFSVFGLDPTGVTAPEELFDHRLGSPLVEDTYALAAGRSATALTLLAESGDVRLLRRGDPSNGTLATADLIYGVSTPGAVVTVKPAGDRLLVADESATQGGDQSAELYWVDPSGAAAPVLVSGAAGEYNLPVD